MSEWGASENHSLGESALKRRGSEAQRALLSPCFMSSFWQFWGLFPWDLFPKPTVIR